MRRRGLRRVRARVGVLERRIDALDAWREALSREVRTARLVVEDRAPAPAAARLVASAEGARVELRLEHAPGAAGRSDLVAFVDAGDADFGAGHGLQLWGAGDALVELNAWRRPDGSWARDVHGTDT